VNDGIHGDFGPVIVPASRDRSPVLVDHAGCTASVSGQFDGLFGGAPHHERNRATLHGDSRSKSATRVGLEHGRPLGAILNDLVEQAKQLAALGARQASQDIVLALTRSFVP